MKATPLQIAVAMALAGSACLLPIAFGQQGGKAAPQQRPLSVAVVDLKQVFEGYHKSKELEQEVHETGEAAQAKGRELVEKVKAIQEQMKSGQIPEGSPQWRAQERKAIQLSAEIKTLEEQTKRDLARQQAAAAFAAWEDVHDALKRFAEHNGYTLILRINADLQAGADATQIERQLTQPIVYRGPTDDITGPVLAWLNKQYDAEHGVQNKAPGNTTSKSTTKAAQQPSAGSPSAAGRGKTVTR